MKLPVLAACLLLLCSASASAKLDVGVVPPDVLGKTPEREEIRISQFRGTVVVVTFWASWCGPCRRELPVLDRLQKAAGTRAKVIAVNVKDSPEDYRIMRRQMKDAALTFTYDKNGSISEGFAVTSYPNLYVIDQAGKIAAVHIGYNEDSLGELVDDINKLLAAPQVAAAAAPARAI